MTSLLKKPLQVCSKNPITGYYRDGYCKNLSDDTGTHVVCATMTDEFLQFSQSKGNNLITPSSGFPGLRQGDKWCLCANRWDEAYDAGKAPPVHLNATDRSALQFNPLSVYRQNQTKNQPKKKRGGFKKKRTIKTKKYRRYLLR